MHGFGASADVDNIPEIIFPLSARGPVTELFIERGITDFSAALAHVRHLPYGRNSGKEDVAVALREGRGTCSTKHALLKALADEHGVEGVRLILGLYRMTEANTPGVGAELHAAGLDYLPEAHVYLRIDGSVMDCTTTGSHGDFLADLIEETDIRPDQIGEQKVAYHRRYLSAWCERNFGGTPDELWTVREACIAALARRGPGSLSD